MIGLGVHLQISTGSVVPTPAPLVADLFEELEITSKEDGGSGFQMKIRAGRSGPFDLLGYRPLTLGSVNPRTRVIFTTIIRGIPRVLFDGIVTQLELAASDKPGEGRLFVTGMEPTFMMDRKNESQTYPAHSEILIANRIIAKYASLGLVPNVIPTTSATKGGIDKDFEVQANETDYKLMLRLAERLGYVFWVEAGPAPGINTAYFGPPKSSGFPQPALTANMGPATNATNVVVREDPSKVKTIEQTIFDKKTGRTIKVKPFSIRPDALALAPTLLTDRQLIETGVLPAGEGNDYQRASAIAKGIQDKSADSAVIATGELDTSRYGSVLKARDLVGLRGLGVRGAGVYRVKEVKHIIKKGSYKQSFTLARTGNFTTLPGLP